MKLYYATKYLLSLVVDTAGRVMPVPVSRTEWALGVGYQSLGTALNGQPVRRDIVRALVAAHPLAAVVETGTFRGATSEFSYVTGAEVHTVEANRRFFEFARLRLRGQTAVHQHFGDSRSFLRTLAQDEHFPKSQVLFYLDAHWKRDLPLLEELRIIRDAWTSSVCIIDDFEVPGDPGYTFDDYGPGMRLCLDYLSAEVIKDRAVLVPSVRGENEGGSRRGCAVIVDTACAATIESLCKLRRVV
jgi:hypothetical protein